MCVYSMVMDSVTHDWQKRWEKLPTPNPFTYPPIFPYTISPNLPPVEQPLTQEEIAGVRRLLAQAAEYDRKNNEPDCELDEKKKLIKELAEKLGVKDFNL